MQTSPSFFGRKIVQNIVFTWQIDNYLFSTIFCNSTEFRDKRNAFYAVISQPTNRWTYFCAACPPAFLMLFIRQHKKSAFTNSKSGGST